MDSCFLAFTPNSDHPIVVAEINRIRKQLGDKVKEVRLWWSGHVWRRDSNYNGCWGWSCRWEEKREPAEKSLGYREGGRAESWCDRGGWWGQGELICWPLKGAAEKWISKNKISIHSCAHLQSLFRFCSLLLINISELLINSARRKHTNHIW